MAKKDKNYISIWFWIFAWIIMSIPIVNVVMICIWAFTGDNESKKNYFKAMILLFLLGVIASIILVALGAAPFVIEYIRGIPSGTP